MPFHLGVGGAWKKADKVHIGVGGVWKTVRKMYIGVGGAWKEFYTNLEVTMGTRNVIDTALSPTDAFATITINSDGTFDHSPAASGTWLTGGTASEVEVMLSGSGNTLWAGSAALDTWLPMSGNRVWGLLETGLSTKTWSGTLTFREIATGITLDTATINIEATVEP